MLARIFVLIGSLLVVALCAALVGPYFVDWTSYRADFEREASAVLGRKVVVKGDAEARILPFPSLSFSDVVVGDADEPALTAASFSMDAELAPFLSGEVLIFDMRLEKPNAVVTIGEDGVVDWAIRPSTPFDPRHVQVERLTVTEGKVRVIDKRAGREHFVSEINADVSARSLAGPWRATGTLNVDGRRARLTASTDQMNDDGSTRLRLTANPDAFPVDIETDGRLSLADGVPAYKGTFRIAGIKPETSNADGEPARLVPDPPPNRLTGSFSLAGERLDIDKFRFETGPLADPYVADGSASVELGKEPRFVVTANGAQVRLTNMGENVNTGQTIQDRFAALQQALSLFTKPPIPGVVDVKLPAVVAGDTTIREVTISAAPALDGWYLSSASALLPGRSTLEAKGFLTTGTAPRFDGSLLLAVKQPSGFAAWLSKDVDAAIRQLPAAGFSADVYLDASRQSFNKLELILGSAKLTGAIERTTTPNAKPVISGALQGGEFNQQTGLALASLFVSDQGAFRFAGHDLDLKLKAGPVSAGGVRAAAVDAAFRVKDDRLDIDKLSVSDMSGASISATGSLKQITGDQVGDLDASIVAADLQPLVELLAKLLPQNRLFGALAARARENPGLFKDGRIDLIANAADAGSNDAQVKLTAKGTAGGSAFETAMAGTVQSGLIADAPVDLRVAVTNADATRLVALTGLPALPLSSLGPGKLTLDFKGTPKAGLQGVASFSATDFLSSFEGLVTSASDGLTGRGRIKLTAADVEPWLMTVGAALPGMGFGTSVELAADADFGKGLLVLNGIGGTIAETSVSGDVNMQLQAGIPLLTGALVLDTLDVDPLVATVLGEAALTPGPEGSWPVTPFRDKPSTPLSADVSLSIGTLHVAGVPVYEANAALQVDGRHLRVADLSGKLAKGTATGLVELKNENGEGLLSGQLRVAGADIATLLPALGVANSGLAGQADISANLASNGKTMGALIASLSGSGTVTVRGLAASGLNDAALSNLIAQSDKIGREIDAARTQSFAPAQLKSGKYQAGDAQFAFSVASGVIRIPATSFDRKKAKLTTELRINLADETLAGTGEFALKPGDAALVGSQPSALLTFSGSLAAPQVAFDTGPLAQFLTQRQLEIEQARVEAMQAALLERQRLRRETAYYAFLQAARTQRADEEARRRETTSRLYREEQARRRAAEQAAAAARARDAVAPAVGGQPVPNPAATPPAANPPGAVPPASSPPPATAAPKLDVPPALQLPEIAAPLPRPERQTKPAQSGNGATGAEPPALQFPPKPDAPDKPASTLGDLFRDLAR